MAELPDVMSVRVNPREAARQVHVTVRITGLRWWLVNAHVGLALVRFGIWLTGARLNVERDDVAR